MLLAAMQPYAFAYLGYYQLINSADRFVVLDDVDFPRRGWVHRNRLGSADGELPFGFPVAKQPRGAKISQMTLHEPDYYCRKFLKTVEHLYRTTPHYDRIYPVVTQALAQPGRKLDVFVIRTIRAICDVLEIDTPILRSSDCCPARAGGAHQNILTLCEAVGADKYINAEGGMPLYDNEIFQSRGIELFFLKHAPVQYRQLCPNFLPRLSIIDVLMHNGTEATRQMLGSCRSYRACEMV